MEGRFMQLPRLLIVDDDSALRTSLFRLLEKQGFQVITAASVSEARQLAQTERTLDIALVDLQLPDGSGMELMSWLQSVHRNCRVVLLTGFGTIATAVQATQQGAFQFLTKPYQLDEVVRICRDALADSRRGHESGRDSKVTPKVRFDQIVGRSKPLTEVLDVVQTVASSDATVLITGESGTGKELIARALHFNSPRASQAFVAINCGAIPSELLESELFGHVKGAFTGAISSRVGRFEMADGGTIFLDEIGDLDPAMQVKLLRALQDRKFEPVGSTKSVSVNVRIVAATNRNLEEMVTQNRFREDLFYRLNVIPIHVPSLRDRKDDIPLLVEHFLLTFHRSKGRGLSGVTPETMHCLTQYPWPGNIRELENLMERVSILKGQGQLELHDLPVRYRASAPEAAAGASVSGDLSGTSNLDFNSAVDQFENRLILRALEKTGWNRNQAAILLRLNRTTLVEKIKKKGLRPPHELANEAEADN